MTHGLSNGHVTDDVTWPQKCCEAVRSAILTYSDSLVSCLLSVRLSQTHDTDKQESHAVAGKPLDAAVNSDRYQHYNLRLIVRLLHYKS